MRRPPFKIDAAQGSIRYTDAAGRARFHSGRCFAVWTSWLRGVIAGTASESATFAKAGCKDAPVECSAAEAREYIAAQDIPPGWGRRQVARCEAIRASRVRRGRPVLGDEDVKAPAGSCAS